MIGGGHPDTPVRWAFAFCAIWLASVAPAQQPELLELNAPVNYSRDNSDTVNAAAFNALAVATRALPSYYERYNDAYAEAVQRQQLFSVAAAARTTAAAQVVDEETVTTLTLLAQAESALGEAQAAYEFAIRKWSAEYSRLVRLRARRVLILHEIYSQRPGHVTAVVVSSPERGEVAQRWVEPPELIEWQRKLNNALGSLAAFRDNVETLLDNQRGLEAKVVALNEQMEEIGRDYQSRLDFEVFVNVYTDITVSASNLFTGGPYALIAEAGYQTFEMFCWAAQARGDGTGCLKDFSYDLPPLTDDMQARLAKAGLDFEEREFEEVMLRWRSRPVTQNVDEFVSYAGRGNASTLPILAIEPDYVWSYLLNVGAASIDAAFVSGSSAALKEASEAGGLQVQLIASDIATMILDSGVPAVTSGATPRDLAEAGFQEAVRRNSHLNFLSSSEHFSGVKGLGISIAVGAAGETIKTAVNNIGADRVELAARAAALEFEWQTARRQLVAHRLLLERYILGVLDVQEQLFEELANPPDEVLGARRLRESLDPPAVVAATSEFTVSVELSAPGTSFPTYLFREGTEVRQRSMPQEDWIYSQAFAPPAGRGLLAFESGNPTFMPNAWLAEAGGFGVFAYPVDHLAAGTAAAESRFLALDLDPSTPVLYFDPVLGRWAGLDRELNGNARYLFDLVRPFELILRNARQEVLVAPR